MDNRFLNSWRMLLARLNGEFDCPDDEIEIVETEDEVIINISWFWAIPAPEPVPGYNREDW